MALNSQIIANVVHETLLEAEHRAPVHFHLLGQEPEKMKIIRASAGKAAAEHVTMAKEFADEPADILARLQKHLPQDRIDMIQAGLSHPTFRMDIVESAQAGLYTVNFTLKGKNGEALAFPSRELRRLEDVDWAAIMQYASIIVECIMLLLSAIGVAFSASGEVVQETVEDVAEVIKKSTKFEKAIEAFGEAWHAAGAGAYAKAKAIFFLVKDTYAAGILWTVIKSLCSSMHWYDWLETAVKVTAMVVAALATDGAALIAEIALVVVSAVDFERKLINLLKLDTIKKAKA